ncbi:DEAD/DEAH box helicase family protein [Bacillus sp. SD075]|uniref:DEAD/DEAH box helicase n=1 Tax=Bacillus sp. SD075 TaxID=2781732 RepID=UPI001A9641F5|nr:DEAD/DEAH box helicase family protein [Bacillus sp. SD075]MBO0996776.1 DEAD/DEAH box helicase family protein [Bacillus sp. SD075]
MVSYFMNNYDNINYPKSFEEIPGLRNAQLGAIHAISSFFTLNKSNAAIVVMPTGSGKTAVLMMAPYVLMAKKVLIVTPSRMVRGQIVEDYSNLKTLCDARVLNTNIDKPIVYEMENLYKEEFKDSIICSQIIVATPACALSLTNNTEINKSIDIVLIDEAHHVPAKTWEQILINMKHAKQLLFTATPFRIDKKEISGELIYNYPLSLAYKDGIFGEIQYVPIDEAPDKDKLIAEMAEIVFLTDREKNLEHYLMIRTNSKKKAKYLEELYGEITNLKLKRIDSSMANSTIKKCIKELKERKLDGIICVDMLGEGFDFPNLKIAAIHDPHKSLANTLQFIGRFARTNADNIGAAKFIAMNDSDLLIENNVLYSNDATWQEMIIDMSESKVIQEESEKEYISEYHIRNSENTSSIQDFSLHGIRPNCHAKIYKVNDFIINANFPRICKVELGPFLNENDNTVAAIGRDRLSPRWSIGGKLEDLENILYLVHFQAETKLLFIYSQIKSESIYEEIAGAFCGSFEKIPKHAMNRVLGNLQEFEIFNSGMQNRFNESGESYRISAGADVSNAIDPSTGKLYSAGHVFCKATTNEGSITIGYSSGSKFWSSSYLTLRDYIRWCDINGLKIANSDIQVKTNTNFDFLPIPQQLEKYPSNIFLCDFSGRTYSNPPTIYEVGKDEPEGILLDILIKIIDIKKENIKLSFSINDVEEEIVCDVNGRYNSAESKFLVSEGRRKDSLSDYLNNYPLTFRTTDDVLIQGIELSQGDPNAIVFSNENILPIDWKGKYGTDITVEFNDDSSSVKSIQSSLKEILEENTKFKYIIYDHSTGEIADYITVSECENEYEITLFHVKKMSAANYNSSMNDVYEVAGQAVKSIIWLKNKSALLKKVSERRRSSHCNFIRGEYEAFRRDIKNEDKMIKGKIVIVQPSISKNTDMPEKIQEVLAAARYYISNSGKVRNLEIWGSN